MQCDDNGRGRGHVAYRLGWCRCGGCSSVVVVEVEVEVEEKQCTLAAGCLEACLSATLAVWCDYWPTSSKVVTKRWCASSATVIGCSRAKGRGTSIANHRTLSKRQEHITAFLARPTGQSRPLSTTVASCLGADVEAAALWPGGGWLWV